MAIIRYVGLAAIARSAFACVCLADDDQSAEKSETREKWITNAPEYSEIGVVGIVDGDRFVIEPLMVTVAVSVPP